MKPLNIFSILCISSVFFSFGMSETSNIDNNISCDICYTDNSSHNNESKTFELKSLNLPSNYESEFREFEWLYLNILTSNLEIDSKTLSKKHKNQPYNNQVVDHFSKVFQTSKNTHNHKLHNYVLIFDPSNYEHKLILDSGIKISL